jgi:DNA polymerase-3 subunit epsilon
MPYLQRSFDDMGTPLQDVTFVVVDVETTGGSPDSCALTEIGAVKLRGGVCLGTFATLVNPGVAIPPAITVLTGITTAMVGPAPRVEAVLPAFLEFAAGATLVGHNVRFDRAFLDAALVRGGWPRLPHRFVDTVALARRLVGDEVRNCRLSTLADHFRLPHRPTHRALDDALATGHLLHALLERAGSLGVFGLDDLLELPTVKGHPQLAKLRLTDGLPRVPGVYLFRDAGGRPLYVGKATNLRSRVRSYFSGEERRKVGQLLRETVAIDHVVTANPLEAAVLEVRLIHQLLPRFNRQATTWKRYAYLKLTLAERFPRLSVVRSVRDDGALYLGPLPSTATARRVAEAIQTATPIRRCSGQPGRSARSGPCAAAQIGVAVCPCDGQLSEEAYAPVVAHVVRGLTTSPDLLLGPLTERMEALAAAERFEEAADVRDRAAALADALRRQRRIDALRRTGNLVIELPGGSVALAAGRLVGWHRARHRPPFDVAPPPDDAPGRPGPHRARRRADLRRRMARPRGAPAPGHELRRRAGVGALAAPPLRPVGRSIAGPEGAAPAVASLRPWSPPSS